VTIAHSNRSLRAGTMSKTIAAKVERSEIAKAHAKEPKKATTSYKRARLKYTQEELLIEAVKLTEMDNKKWLLSRKREQEDSARAAGAHALKEQKVFKARYHSRKGCYNTITFPQIDDVPLILRGKQPGDVTLVPTVVAKCVITGKVAKYKDPRTGQPFFDKAAFAEVRRRFVPIARESRGTAIA
jgi:vacuolar protein sorting-associated protein 72